MLLRRITKHVTNQNWFAVFIDFLIVVVGVFIGIQVANWNAERQVTHQQQLVHQRLLHDFNLLEELSEQSLARNKEIIVSLDTLIQAFERGEVLPEEDEAIKLALRWGGSYRKLMQRSPTFVELLSSGQLELITDEKVRHALAKFDQRALTTEFNFRSIHNVVAANYNYLPKYATLEAIDPINPEIRLVDSYDFKAMLADESYQTEQKIILDIQSWFYSNIKQHNALLKEVRLILEGRD